MRRACLAIALCCSGCLKGSGPIDPNNPDELDPCPTDRAHLAIALQTRDYESTQALLRAVEGSFAYCQGLSLPYEDYGTIETVGGMPDGSELVGFSDDYDYGGRAIHFDGADELGRIESEADFPIAIAPVVMSGQAAVAIIWGTRPGVTDDAERITIHAAGTLASMGEWTLEYQTLRVAAASSGQPDRVAALDWADGMQEMRADPGSTTLATTGELRVELPTGTGYIHSIDVVGGEVRVGSSEGVLYWRAGAGNAFLGPVYCRWPATLGGILPERDADYGPALIDPRDPADLTLVLVGDLYTLRHRGECERALTFPTTHAAVALSWAGR